jgi:hypothetical protein
MDAAKQQRFYENALALRKMAEVLVDSVGQPTPVRATNSKLKKLENKADLKARLLFNKRKKK